MTATRLSDAPAAASYEFGTGTPAGVWLGLGAGRVALIGIGLTASILSLTARVPAGLAAVPVLFAVAVAAARLGGRPLVEWVAPVCGHRSAAVSGAARWRGPFPTSGGLSRQPGSEGVRLRMPREFGRLRLHDCPHDPTVGLLVDAATRTVTVVFDVAGVDRFPLLDPGDRDSLIVGWGQTLTTLADTDDALARLQVLERATHPPAAPNPDPDTSRPAAADDPVSRLVDDLATWHDSRLAVQWGFPRIDDTALASIAGRARTVSRCLLSAQLVTRPLSAADIGADLATALRGPRCLDAQSGAPVGLPGPVSRRTSWSHVATDDTYHRCYAVTGWPRTPVTADWLAPLLLSAPTGVTRTVTIHLERVTPAAAARTARTARAKAALDQRDRVRLGMTTSAAIDRAEVGGVAMDEELAAGYRTHRLTALVALSGTTLGALDDAAGVLRQAAAACRWDLQPLHGQHDRALAAALPLCRVRPRGQA